MGNEKLFMERETALYSDAKDSVINFLNEQAMNKINADYQNVFLNFH